VALATLFIGTVVVLFLAAVIAVVLLVNFSGGVPEPVQDCATTGLALLRAAHAGDAARVDELVAEGQLHRVDGDQRTALYCAARGGQTAVVEQLLAAGADPDLANAAGDTPLLWAAQQGDVATVDALLAGGAAIDQATDAGHTPLLRAVYGGHDDVVARLLDAGADPDLPAGIDSLEAELLLGGVLGGEPIAPDRDPYANVPVGGTGALPAVTGTPADGVTALHVATALGRTDLVTALVAAGAHVDAEAIGGYTPLHVAALVGDGDSAFVLLLGGADPAVAGGRVPTPSELAIDMGHPEVAEVIDAALVASAPAG
jgi:ankyrin repeat protein